MRAIAWTLPALTVLALPGAAVASPYWAWTLSTSPTDPFANIAETTSGVVDAYLWYNQLGQLTSLSEAEFGLTSNGPTILSVTPMNGYAVSGFPPYELWITAPNGCAGYGVAAHLEILAAPGEICFGPGLLNGNLCASDCNGVEEPLIYYLLGLSFHGFTPCERSVTGECPASGSTAAGEPWEPVTWGRAKAAYR